jgi:hypothetical protein
MKKYIVVFLLIFIGCTSSENNIGSNVIKTIKCDFSTFTGIDSELIFKKSKFISLEAKDGKLLGQINKVQISKDQIFCSTKNNISVFNLEGKFLFEIANKGEGPSQYKSITDFIINDRIRILDSRSRKIFEYDTQGNFIESWGFPLFAVRFHQIDDDQFFFYSSNTPNEESDYMVNLVSKKSGKIAQKFLKIDPRKIDYFQYLDVNNFATVEGKTNFFMSGSHEVFEWRKDAFIPMTKFDLDGRGIPDEVYQQKFMDVSYFDNFLKSKDMIDFLNTFYVENKKQIIAGLTHQREKKYWLVYDKNNQKSSVYNSMNLPIGNKKFEISFNPENSPVGVSSKHLIMAFEPDQFLEEIKHSKLSKTDFKHLSFDQNQILIVGELIN